MRKVRRFSINKKNSVVWENCRIPTEYFADTWEFNRFDYRIKPTPKPPTYRTWKPEEVPVGALIKNKYLRSLIIACDNSGNIYTGHTSNNFTSAELLSNQWQYSTDNGKTWQPCGVLVVNEGE